MTPLQIEILLHYRCKADDYRGGDFSSPAVIEAMRNFVLDAMLAPASGDRGYELGERGQAFVDALCALPLPVRKWSMP